ncbi:MAG: cytochrome c [Planctomycetota bacterium]
MIVAVALAGLLGGCGDRPEERPDPFSLGYSPEQVERAVARGAELYKRHACNACHRVDGVDAVEAPSWNGIFGQPAKLADGTTVVRDYRYLRRAIRRPHEQIVLPYGASMSSYPQLTPEDVDALLWYIWSLRDPETDAPPDAPASGVQGLDGVEVSS